MRSRRLRRENELRADRLIREMKPAGLVQRLSITLSPRPTACILHASQQQPYHYHGGLRHIDRLKKKGQSFSDVIVRGRPSTCGELLNELERDLEGAKLFEPGLLRRRPPL